MRILRERGGGMIDQECLCLFARQTQNYLQEKREGE